MEVILQVPPSLRTNDAYWDDSIFPKDSQSPLLSHFPKGANNGTNSQFSLVGCHKFQDCVQYFGQYHI